MTESSAFALENIIVVRTCYSKNLVESYESLGWLKLAKKTLRRCQARISRNLEPLSKLKK